MTARFNVADAEAQLDQRRSSLCRVGVFAVSLHPEELAAVEVLVGANISPVGLIQWLAERGVDIGVKETATRRHLQGICSCPPEVPLQRGK